MFSSDAEIAAAAKLLREGKAVVFPTETVYGLGAHAMDPEAVSRIFAIKGRPQDNPIIVHVASSDLVTSVASAFPDTARFLFERFSPGPLTVVLPASSTLPTAVSAGLGTVAIRIPKHPVAQKLLAASGIPIAAPSANLSGEPSATRLDMARGALGDGPAAYLDGGPCSVGLESTVVRIVDGEVVVLRPGAITVADIEAALPGVRVRRPSADPEAVHSPGVRHRHYTPNARVLLFRNKDDLLGLLSAVETRRAAVLLPKEMLDLALISASVTTRAFHSLEEYARNLYGWFADLDAADCQTILAFLPPEDELGEAIADRLVRAAGNTKPGLQSARGLRRR